MSCFTFYENDLFKIARFIVFIEIDMSKKESSKNNRLNDEDYEYVTVPPDGGFGWVVAFAAMVIMRFLIQLFCFHLRK